MGFFDLLSPRAWRRAAAEKVTWDGAWPQSSPTRTLKQFWFPGGIKIPKIELPLGTIATEVTPCLNVQFRFDHGRIVIEKAWVCQSVAPNCSSEEGESFKAPSDFFPRGAVEALLQKQADTLKSYIRSRIYAVMAQEREDAGLDVPQHKKPRTRRKSPPA